MQFKYKNKTYSMDLEDKLSVAEARALKQHTGMTIQDWMDGIQAADVDALCGIVFLAVRRAGDDIEWSDMDDMDLMQLAADVAEVNGMDVEALKRGEVPAVPAAVNRAQRRAAPKKPAAQAS